MDPREVEVQENVVAWYAVNVEVHGIRQMLGSTVVHNEARDSGTRCKKRVAHGLHRRRGLAFVAARLVAAQAERDDTWHILSARTARSLLAATAKQQLKLGTGPQIESANALEGTELMS